MTLNGVIRESVLVYLSKSNWSNIDVIAGKCGFTENELSAIMRDDKVEVSLLDAMKILKACYLEENEMYENILNCFPDKQKEEISKVIRFVNNDSTYIAGSKCERALNEILKNPVVFNLYVQLHSPIPKDVMNTMLIPLVNIAGTTIEKWMNMGIVKFENECYQLARSYFFPFYFQKQFMINSIMLCSEGEVGKGVQGLYGKCVALTDAAFNSIRNVLIEATEKIEKIKEEDKVKTEEKINPTVFGLYFKKYVLILAFLFGFGINTAFAVEKIPELKLTSEKIKQINTIKLTQEKERETRPESGGGIF
jgi:hypothetical protein